MKPQLQLEGTPRKIVGFQLDEKLDWVAKLECGHQQHVRDCQVHHRQHCQRSRDFNHGKTDLSWECNASNRIGLREAEGDDDRASKQDHYRVVDEQTQGRSPLEGWTSIE